MPATPIEDMPQSDTSPERGPGKVDKTEVKVRVTKMGAGKVSTGKHVSVEGDTFAKANDMLTLPKYVAEALEARGLAEIQ